MIGCSASDLQSPTRCRAKGQIQFEGEPEESCQQRVAAKNDRRLDGWRSNTVNCTFSAALSTGRRS